MNIVIPLIGSSLFYKCIKVYVDTEKVFHLTTKRLFQYLFFIKKAEPIFSE